MTESDSTWVQYTGRCMIFAGIEQIEDPDSVELHGIPKIWTMEAEEITKHKLINGLLTIGVKCDSVVITMTFPDHGLRMCRCVCYYDKPYNPYESELFIKGLTLIPSSKSSNKSIKFYLDT